MLWSKLASVCLLGMALTVPSIYGHGRLVVPTNREQQAGRQIHTQNAPAPYGPDFTCKGVGPQTPQTTLVAGQSLPVQWDMEAPHPGDCFFYLSYDTNLPPEQQEWFKIAEFSECDVTQGTRQSIRIPDYVPPCDHCVLRFEWYAIQQVTNIEFYANCVDVRIQSSATNGVLGTPRIRVPNHLPRSNPAGSGNYRLAYTPPKRLFFTGPAMAVPDRAGAPRPTAGAPAPASTRPAPGTTAAPAPGTTAAPAPASTRPAPTTTAAPTGTGSSCTNVVWNQCGGNNFRGSTCCPSGTTCARQNEWYHQCIPGTGAGARSIEEASSQSSISTTVAGIAGFFVGGVLAVAAVAVIAVVAMRKPRVVKSSLETELVSQKA